MWTDKQFWADSTWRAWRTFCQTLAAMMAGQTVNVLTAPWSGMLGVAAGSALVSLLMSMDRERVAVATAKTPGVYITENTVEPLPADPSAPDYQPPAAFLAGSCGGDLR
jgi:hypothetical protein